MSIRSDNYYIFIPPNSEIGELGNILKENEVISNKLSFIFVSDMLKYTPPKKGGLFEIRKNWNNISLVNHLKEARNIPYNILKIQPYRFRKKILKDICGQLGLNITKLEKALYEDPLLRKEKFNKESVYCLFIPGEYKIPKGISEKEFISFLYSEYLHFWNNERRDRLSDIDLSHSEAIILASIVFSETKIYTEMPEIAGVYLNRLKKGMRLEADPTLVFASGNFGMRRVFVNNKKLPYPEYNTYKVKGLPPGPIHFPPPEVIDAVLNSREHNFYYFCAKGDSSGCHLFAETYEDHKINAANFRKQLDRKKIFR